MNSIEPARCRKQIKLGARRRWAQFAALVIAMGLPAAVRCQGPVLAAASKIAYNAGQTVRVRVFFAAPQRPAGAIRIVATVRYEGGRQSVLSGKVLFPAFDVTPQDLATPYAALWKIPENAATGRYDVSLTLSNARSGQTLLAIEDACSFAVFRKSVNIDRISLNKDLYTSGDPVSARIVLKNMTGRELSHLRVEFSDRYWPWIAGPAAAAAASIVPVAKDLSIGPGEQRQISAPNVATALNVSQPAVHQYGVVVWDEARKNVLAIAFSSIVFIYPPGVASPQLYPRQYVYPLLKYVNTTAYRHFFPATLDSAAIVVDSSRTMYTPGSMAHVRFTVQNPTTRDWDVRLGAALIGPDGKAIEGWHEGGGMLLASHSKPVERQADFRLPRGAGNYRVEITLSDTAGNVLASNVIELAVNELPKSILIFCAHEDDEGAWMPWIRAAVENDIPVHLVYFTGGDAGSCDVYYEHSCSPADALNFGVLRMDETRAVLGHLGLPATDIDFAGLPDGGSGEIWYNHASSSNPFLDPVLASDHTPYAGMVQPNLPYARDAAVALAKKLILKFNPEVVITAHPPSEGHIDHIVNGYIAVRALQELVRQGAIAPTQVKVLVDRVYNPRTLPYTPYHYAEHTFYVSGECAALDQEAEWYYQSQGGDMALGRIRGYGQLGREVKYREILDWLDYKGWNNSRRGSAPAPQGAR